MDNTSLDLDIYFIKLLITLWFFIFPVAFFFSFLFIREFNKIKNIYVVWRPLRNFKPYGYFFHNILFCCLFIANIFNLLLFIYVLVDTYILNLDSIYESLWKTNTDTNDNDRFSFVWGTFFLGIIMHLVSFSFYSYHNLYHTDSYFGEKWRNFIVNFVKSNRFFMLRARYPRLFRWLIPRFLRVRRVMSREEKEEVVVSLT